MSDATSDLMNNNMIAANAAQSNYASGVAPAASVNGDAISRAAEPQYDAGNGAYTGGVGINTAPPAAPNFPVPNIIRQAVGLDPEIAVHPTATVPRQDAPGSAEGTNYGNEGRGVSALEQTNARAPVGPISAAVAGVSPPAAPSAPAAPGMTTEQSNAYYGPINAAMTAKAAQDRQQSVGANIAQGDSSAAGYRADQAENLAMRARNNSAATGPRAVRDAQTNADVQRGIATAADGRLAGALGNRNYIAEAQAGQNLTQGAQESATKNAVGQQQIAQGAQSLKKGDFELKHQALIQDLANRLGQAKQGTPEYKQLLGSYRVLTGKDASNFKTEVVQGETYFDPSNPTVPLTRGGRVVTQDLNDPDGLPHEVPLGQQTAQPAPQPEGQRGTVNGVRGSIKNGKFTPDAQ